MSESPLKTKSFELAVAVVRMVKGLQESKREFVMSKQLLRCDTSVGANIAEAQAGLTTADFSAKLSIAYKECQETLYWLELMHTTQYISYEEYGMIKSMSTEVSKMLFASLKTTGRIR